MKFDLIVDKTETNSGLELLKLEWPGCKPPDIVRFNDSLILMIVGKLLTPGERYSYRMATIADITGGRLLPVDPPK